METAVTFIHGDSQYLVSHAANILEHLAGTIQGFERKSPTHAGHEIPKETAKENRRIQVAKKTEDVGKHSSSKTHERASWVTRRTSKDCRESHGKSRMVSELEAHNAFPSDTDTSTSSVPSKKPKPSKIRKKEVFRMKKELALPKSAPRESRPLDILADFGVHVTRRISRSLINLSENQPIPPRRSLNLAILSGLRPNVVQEELDDLEEGSQYQGSTSSSSDDTNLNRTQYDKFTYNSREKALNEPSPNKPKITATASVAAFGDTPVLGDVQYPRKWDEWVEQKERVTALLNANRYSTRPACMASGAAFLAQQPAYQALVDLPPNYNFAMDAGVYVFSPTKEIFDDFANFIEVIEAVAGRKHGVVKVIVPETAVLPIGSINSDSLQNGLDLLPSYKVSLGREKVKSNEVLAYHVESTPVAAVLASPVTIDRHRATIIDKWATDSKHWDEAWREISYETTIDEEAMMEIMGSKEEHMLLTSTTEGNNALRRRLDCRKLNLRDLRGNRFLNSRYKPIDPCPSSMTISQNGVTPFGIHIEHLAAYSINYLHKGAPRCWTIIKPADHWKLEEAIHNELSNTLPGRGLSARLPPQCDQALGHHGLYLPKATLQRFDVGYIDVVQHQNEMVVTFPFAYRQGYNTGPNISEEMAYASERWEVFLKNQLYRQCDERCPMHPWQSPRFLLRESSEIVGSRHKVQQNSNSVTSKKQNPPGAFRSKDIQIDVKVGKDVRTQPRGRKRSIHDRRELSRASKAQILPEAKRPSLSQQIELQEAINNIMSA